MLIGTCNKFIAPLGAACFLYRLTLLKELGILSVTAYKHVVPTALGVRQYAAK
jgi:hypothetical protein